MRIGMVWGMLAGLAVVALAGWIVSGLSGPRSPGGPAVRQSPGDVVETVPSVPGGTEDENGSTAGGPQPEQLVVDAPGTTGPANEAAPSEAGSAAGQPVSDDPVATAPSGPAAQGGAGSTTDGVPVAADTDPTGTPATAGTAARATGAADPADRDALRVEPSDGPETAAGTSDTDADAPEAAMGAPDTDAAAPEPGAGGPEAGAGGHDTEAAAAERLAALLPQAPAPAAGLPPPGGAAAPPEGPGAPQIPAEPAAPEFDVVRTDASGQTIIAGRAQPGQDVEVLLDGEVVETVRADGMGKFVAVIVADLTGGARQLQLRVTVPTEAPARVTVAAGEPTEPQDAAEGGAPAGPQITASPDTASGSSTAGSSAAATAAATTAPSREAAPSSEGLPVSPEDPVATAATDRDTPGAAPAAPAPPPSPAAPGEPQAAIAPGTVAPSGPIQAGSAPTGLAATDQGPTGTRPEAPAAVAEDAASEPDGGTARPAVATPGAEVDAPATDRTAPDAESLAVAPAGEASAMAAADAEPRAEAAPGPSPPDPGTAAAPAAASAAAAAPGDEPTEAGPDPGTRYVLSAPVLILPATGTDDAPTLVQPQTDELALLQPGGRPAGAPDGVALDQITYAEAGELTIRGRARSDHAIRLYGDGRILETVPVQDGGWEVSLPRDRAQGLSLLRMDEIDPAGKVTSRVEAPFRYTGERPQELRAREVIVQRGDNLWTIAEQHYGEGLRYSVIFGANSDLIRDPDLIYPDQVFSIPELVEAD